MKRTLLSFLAIFFPWIVLLIEDDPAGALIAMVLQLTIIGWIPASAWAFRSIRENEPAKTKKTPKTNKSKGTDLDAKS